MAQISQHRKLAGASSGDALRRVAAAATTASGGRRLINRRHWPHWRRRRRLCLPGSRHVPQVPTLSRGDVQVGAAVLVGGRHVSFVHPRMRSLGCLVRAEPEEGRAEAEESLGGEEPEPGGGPMDEELDSDAEKLPNNLSRLQEAYWSRDYDKVASMIFVMGAGDDADKLHAALEEAVLQEGSADRFTMLLYTLRKRDVPPHHPVDLYRKVESWFHSTASHERHYNEVSLALQRADHLDEAWDLVRAMEMGAMSCRPNTQIYTALMADRARERGPRAAAELLTRTGEQGCEPDAISYFMMVVVNVRAQPPDVESAKHWFRKAEDRMCREKSFASRSGRARERRVLVLYSTLMTAYTRLGRLKDAFTLLGRMRSRGIKPDVFTFQILMHGCLCLSNYGMQECRLLIRVMQEMGVEPTSSVYNLLIRSFGRAGQLTGALRIGNRMREAGIRWDRYTYEYLIGAVVTAGQVELAVKFLSNMRSDGIRPRASHYTMTFQGLAVAGLYEDAATVFQRLCALREGADQHAYNMMIRILTFRGDMPGALKVHEQMLESGFESNAMTYRVLLQGYVSLSQWDDALALQEPFQELRRRLSSTLEDPEAAASERLRAKAALESPQERHNWTRAYYILIDAATWQGQWGRAVLLLEDLIEQGLPPHPWRHSRLLRDTKRSVRMHPTVDKMLLDARSANDEKELQRQQTQSNWVRRATNSREAEATRPGVRQEEGEQPRKVVEVPPHMFCASLSPDWIIEEEPARATKMKHLFRRFLGGSDVSPRDLYRVIHDYHHAVAQRRPLHAVSLEPWRFAIVRNLPETTSSLQQLFAQFGQPGSRTCPLFVFTRPSAASLDALLALLAASIMHSSDVLLLRPQDLESPEEVVKEQRRAVEECKARGNASMSYSIASILANLPAALLLNSRLLMANGTDLETSSPGDFEAALRPALRLQDSPSEAVLSLRNKPESWAIWLHGQGLQQLVRCDVGKVRLDGKSHVAAMSTGEVFRVRSEGGDDFGVDLLLDEDGSSSRAAAPD